MIELAIELDGGRVCYEPGARMSGEVFWNLAEEAESVELRLFWYTYGRGTQDVETVDGVTWDAPVRSGKKPFEIVLPEEPYSYSGTLLSISWALELICQPSGDVERMELMILPETNEDLV